MENSTKPTSNRWRATGWLRSMATYGRRTVELLKTSISWVVRSALACFVLVLVAIPDLMMNSRRQSKTPAPARKARRLQIPIRNGGEIFVIEPDGSRTGPLTILEAKTHAMAWLDVTTGVAVWEQTKIPHAKD